jgi:hypothetical protein
LFAHRSYSKRSSMSSLFIAILDTSGEIRIPRSQLQALTQQLKSRADKGH